MSSHKHQLNVMKYLQYGPVGVNLKSWLQIICAFCVQQPSLLPIVLAFSIWQEMFICFWLHIRLRGKNSCSNGPWAKCSSGCIPTSHQFMPDGLMRRQKKSPSYRLFLHSPLPTTLGMGPTSSTFHLLNKLWRLSTRVLLCHSIYNAQSILVWK